MWDELDRILSAAISAVASAGNTDGGLVAKAGQLIIMDSFSLGSLASGGGIYTLAFGGGKEAYRPGCIMLEGDAVTPADIQPGDTIEIY